MRIRGSQPDLRRAPGNRQGEDDHLRFFEFGPFAARIGRNIDHIGDSRRQAIATPNQGNNIGRNQVSPPGRSDVAGQICLQSFGLAYPDLGNDRGRQRKVRHIGIGQYGLRWHNCSFLRRSRIGDG